MTISANFPQIAPSLDLDFANSVALDPRISYSRSTTGTYYDGQTSAIAEQNLLYPSNGFTTNPSWNPQPQGGSTLTSASTTAPDGTTTGWLYSVTSSSSRPYFGSNINYNTATSLYRTFTIYAKVGTTNYLQLNGVSGTTSYANFDLSAGTVTATGGANTTASITSVGSGWYRCLFTFNETVFYQIGIQLINLSTSPNLDTATVTGGVYIWGAQLENRSFATVYTPTTTAAITNYIPQLLTAPVNQPRFDFNPTTRQSLGLLMEQQSTNLVTYSSDYTQSVWTKTNSTVTAATNISPDGTLNAQSLTDNSTNDVHRFSANQSFTGTAAGANTFSVYLKAGTIGFARLQFIGGSSNSTNIQCGINLTTGAFGTPTFNSGTGTFSSVNVGNGWWRCSVTATMTGAGVSNILVYTVPDTTTVSYVGTGQNIFVWGAQVEALAFPTSYIPTVASQVTRAQDFATMTGTNFSSWFNNQQGTIYCSFDMASITASNYFTLYEISNGSTYGYYAIRQGGNTLQFATQNGTTSGVTITGSNTTQQSAMQYTNITTPAISGLINGGSAVTSSTTNSYTPNQFRLGCTYQGGNVLCGHIRKFAYYPIASTSAQMQALTGS